MTDLAQWVTDTAQALRDYQRGNRYTSHNPEREAVEFVLACLTEGACPQTAGVLDYVDRRRAGMVSS